MKYLYCITKEDCGEALKGVCGINNAPVGTLASGGVVCVLSDIENKEKSLDREAAMAHAKVLEAVMEEATILPLAFGHIVSEAEEVKVRFLDPYRDTLMEAFDYLEGKIELNLKVFWPDMQPIFAKISEVNQEIQQMKKKSKLTRDEQIRAGEIAAKEIERKRNECAKQVIKEFENTVVEYKENKPFGDAMIANIAFLLQKEQISEFDKVVNACAERFGSDVYFKSIGPVPPYNFTNVKITV